MQNANAAAPGRSGFLKPWNGAMERLWRRFFGSPDLGGVDFATLTRRTTPNDALICPTAFAAKARPDAEPPVFNLPVSRLRELVRQAALAEPDTWLVESAGEQDRFLVRTRLMRFPDTVVAQVIEQDPGASTLALYSRSQIGRSDFGVNKRRLVRWLAALDRLAAREQDGR